MITETIAAFEELCEDIKQTLDGLSNEALDWSPGPEMNSISVLATHSTGALRYWIGDVIMRESSDRDRPSEFRTRDMDAATLIARLDDVMAYVRDALPQVTVADLDSTRPVPSSGETVTVAEALNHVLVHTATHLGHMQMVRHLWSQKHEQHG